MAHRTFPTWRRIFSSSHRTFPTSWRISVRLCNIRLWWGEVNTRASTRCTLIAPARCQWTTWTKKSSIWRTALKH